MQGCSVRTGHEFPKPNTPTYNWYDSFDALFFWSNGICLVLIAGCIATLIWIPLPALKKWALFGITFAGALLGCGIVFAVMKPFIPIIVMSTLAIAVVIGVWYGIRHFDVLKQLANKDEEDLTPYAKKIVDACKIPPTIQ